MKIRASDINRLITQPDDRYLIYLLYGHDQGLISEYSRSLAQQFCDDLNDPFSVVSLTGDEISKDESRLNDEINSLTHLSKLRLVLLIGKGTEMTTAIKAVLSNMNPQTRLIIKASDVNTRHALVKICDESPICASIGCYLDDNRSLRRLAEQIFERDHISIEPQAMDLLLLRLGADRQLSRAEIEKLALYCGPNKHLQLADIETVIADSGAVLIDDLFIAVLNGNIDAFERHFNRMRHEGIQPIMIMRQILTSFRSLWTAKLAMAENKTAEQAVNMIRPPLHFRIKPIVLKQIGLWSQQQIADAINRLVQTEIKIKSSFSGDPAILLGQILLGLCLRAGKKQSLR